MPCQYQSLQPEALVHCDKARRHGQTIAIFPLRSHVQILWASALFDWKFWHTNESNNIIMSNNMTVKIDRLASIHWNMSQIQKGSFPCNHSEPWSSCLGLNSCLCLFPKINVQNRNLHCASRQSLCGVSRPVCGCQVDPSNIVGHSQNIPESAFDLKIP